MHTEGKVEISLYPLRKQLELMKGKDLSWSDIAAAADLNPNTVYNLAAKRSKRVDFETLTKLYHYFRAQGLDITPGDLLIVETPDQAEASAM